jgi:hypothetical protein
MARLPLVALRHRCRQRPHLNERQRFRFHHPRWPHVRGEVERVAPAAKRGSWIRRGAARRDRTIVSLCLGVTLALQRV